ncbi:hypothetical protein KKC_15529, partial [Listeria fleischmannii subsp. coloradonensis]
KILKIFKKRLLIKKTFFINYSMTSICFSAGCATFKNKIAMPIIASAAAIKNG